MLSCACVCRPDDMVVAAIISLQDPVGSHPDDIMHWIQVIACRPLPPFMKFVASEPVHQIGSGACMINSIYYMTRYILRQAFQIPYACPHHILLQCCALLVNEFLTVSFVVLYGNCRITTP